MLRYRPTLDDELWSAVSSKQNGCPAFMTGEGMQQMSIGAGHYSGVLDVKHISHDVLKTIEPERIGLLSIRIQAQQLQAMLIRVPDGAAPLRLFWGTCRRPARPCAGPHVDESCGGVVVLGTPSKAKEVSGTISTCTQPGPIPRPFAKPPRGPRQRGHHGGAGVNSTQLNSTQREPLGPLCHR